MVSRFYQTHYLPFLSESFQTFHGGLKQEKSQKWCLGLGPIYLEFLVLGKSRKFIPVRQQQKKPFCKVFFFNNQSKILLNNIYSQGAICIIIIQYQLNLSTLIFHKLMA